MIDTSTKSQIYLVVTESIIIEYERKYLQQIRIVNMYHTFTYLSMIEAYIEDEITLKEK